MPRPVLPVRQIIGHPGAHGAKDAATGAGYKQSDKGRRQHIPHKHLPDADSAGLGIPRAVVSVYRAAGRQGLGNTPLAVLRAHPIRRLRAGRADINCELRNHCRQHHRYAPSPESGGNAGDDPAKETPKHHVARLILITRPRRRAGQVSAISRDPNDTRRSARSSPQTARRRRRRSSVPAPPLASAARTGLC